MINKLEKYHFIKRIIITVLVTLFSSLLTVEAGVRFTSSYPCTNTSKTCASRGTRMIDGFPVHKDCWEWTYSKTCSYPSRDDCKNYMIRHCYFVANGACLLKDSVGNCVNLQREFSCKSWEPVTIENKTTRTGKVEKDGPEQLICNGVPCIDGNCVDKSYQTNGEMMDSVTKLYAASKMKPDGMQNFNLFQGTAQHCSKKATGYSNCCRQDPKGWGKQLGARCTKDENTLAELRSRNMCVYVGKQNKMSMGVTTVVKHQFCCWGSLLDKVIQVQGRGQLNMSFGSGGSPDCRGFTLEEIQRLNFSTLDLSEFIDDFKLKFVGKLNLPTSGELARKVDGSTAGIRKYDDNSRNQKNNMTGWNVGADEEGRQVEDDRRFEAEERERIRQEQLAMERKERERQTAVEAQRRRVEQVRLAKIETDRRMSEQVRLEEERRKKPQSAKRNEGCVIQ